jgi:hypothetical protein
MTAGFTPLVFLAEGIAGFVLNYGETRCVMAQGDFSGFANAMPEDRSCAILNMAGDQSLRSTMGRAGRERVEQVYLAALVVDPLLETCISDCRA